MAGRNASSAPTTTRRLVLVPRLQLRGLNAQLEFLGEAAEIVVHPTTPPAAGASDDQRLIVRSAHRELTGVARVDASVRRGAVLVPHGHAGANVNLLASKDDIDLVTRMTRYSGVPVSLHPGMTLLRGDLVRLDGNKWTLASAGFYRNSMLCFSPVAPRRGPIVR